MWIQLLGVWRRGNSDTAIPLTFDFGDIPHGKLRLVRVLRLILYEGNLAW